MGRSGPLWVNGRSRRLLPPSGGMKYASDNVLRLIERWRFLIGLAIILAVYAIALIAFLTYRSMEEATFWLRRQTVAKCLDSGGHIGRNETCWHATPNEKNEIVP